MRWSVILLLLMVGVLPAQANDDWQYAYITDDAEGKTLWLVAPTDLQARQYPLTNAEARLAYVLPSPDGQQILLWFNQSSRPWADAAARETSILRLLNMQTGEMRDLARLPYYVDDDFAAPSPLWSPNSRYITHLDKVYDLATGDTLTLGIPFLARAWSPDSSMLAVGDSICYERECSAMSLRIIHVPDMKLTQGATFDNWWDVCNLNWSPDQKTIAFEFHCFFLSSGFFGYGEILEWNLAANSISPLTHYTTTPADYMEQRGYLPDGLIDYSTFWLNPESLLVSVQHWDFISTPDGYIPDALTFRVGTDLYDVSDGSHARISDEWVNTWAKNPRNEQVAYQIERVALSANGMIVRMNPRTEIAVLDGLNLSVQQTLLSGCNLAWSPDGEWLALTNAVRDRITLRSECSHPTALHFAASDASVTPRQVSLPQNAMLVGWVQPALEDVPFFPEGTPTPIPTPAITGAG